MLDVYRLDVIECWGTFVTRKVKMTLEITNTFPLLLVEKKRLKKKSLFERNLIFISIIIFSNILFKVLSNIFFAEKEHSTMKIQT